MLFRIALGVVVNALVVAASLPSGNSTRAVAQFFGDSFSHTLDPLLLGKRQRDEDENGALLCAEGKPCSDGSCCGNNGKCGYGPTFCGLGNCTSKCTAVAMCGQYGDREVNGGKCGMSLCCSASGWCGTSDNHCTGVTGSPCQKDFGPCQKASPRKCGVGSGSSSKRTIGYYQGSNIFDRACNKIAVKDIDTTKYTYLYYAFASIDPTTFQVKPGHFLDTLVYKDFTALKSPVLQTWIAVGGFDFSDPREPTHFTWSELVASPANRQAFIQSLKDFMILYGFQGVDIDWEYPVDQTRGGDKEDTANLRLLLKEMREGFGTAFGISLALAPDYWYLRHFDAKAMEQYVDWFGFMTYDLHGFWDGDNDNIGSTVRGQAGIDEIRNNTAPLYFAGLDFSKINFGLANYGRGYTLGAPLVCKELGCPFTGPNKPAKCTGTPGVMSLTEIKSLIKEKGLQPKLLGPQMMKSIQWADQWIGYDDEETFAMKKAWADDYCFGGTMAWSVDYHSGVGSGNDLAETTDGRCGPEAKTRCGAGSNKCCSAGGWCGDSEDHCGGGCQSLYGDCQTGGNTNDGTCGIAHNEIKCGSFLEGPCCSSSGFCGFSIFHCSLENTDGMGACQSGCESWNDQISHGVKEPVNPNTGPDSTCRSLKGPRDLTREVFQKINTKKYFEEWFSTAEKEEGWLPEIARPLGMQRSLKGCSINNPCRGVNCADMDSDEIPGSGWRYLVIMSAINLNLYLNKINSALDDAAMWFLLDEVAWTNDFFYTHDPEVFLDSVGLTALAAGISTIFSLGNPFAAATGAALAGVVYEGILLVQNQGKISFDTKLQAFQQIAHRFVNCTKDAFTNVNLGIVQGEGVWKRKDQKDTNAVEWLGEGDWVNDAAIPFLRDDEGQSVRAAGKTLTSYLGATIVNFAWHNQGVYIGCYTMSEDDFKGIDKLDDALKIYYKGRGCFFQCAFRRSDNFIWADPPQGYDKLQVHGFDFNTHHILKSSIDSYKNHGFGADLSKDTSFYESIIDKISGGPIQDAFSTQGMFNLPLCELDKHFDKLDDFKDKIHTSGGFFFHMWCYCFDDRDANGKKITDYLQVGDKYGDHCVKRPIPDDPDPNPGPIGV